MVLKEDLAPNTPNPALRDIWQCLEIFLVVTLRMGMPLAIGGYQPVIMLNILQSAGQHSTTKYYPGKNVNSAKAEKS